MLGPENLKRPAGDHIPAFRFIPPPSTPFSEFRDKTSANRLYRHLYLYVALTNAIFKIEGLGKYKKINNTVLYIFIFLHECIIYIL